MWGWYGSLCYMRTTKAHTVSDSDYCFCCVTWEAWTTHRYHDYVDVVRGVTLLVSERIHQFHSNFTKGLIIIKYRSGPWKYHARLVWPVPFHSGQVENFNLLVLGQVQNLYKVAKILYFIFWLSIMSSHVALKTVCVLISWLLKKPADLDLHCLQESWYLHGFILFSKL